MFGFNIDRKFIYILLGALLLMSLMSYSRIELLSLLLTLPAVIIAITFHEYAHAYAADKLGDDTPKSNEPYRSSRIYVVNVCWIWLGKTSTNKPKKL